MKVFLTGATGFVGSAVARNLIERGHFVVGLSRSEASDAKLSALGIEPHRGDLHDPQSLAMAALFCDGVVHTAFGQDFDHFENMVHTELMALTAMLTALEDKNKPFVSTNGPAFLGDSGDAVLDETAPIDETSYFAPRAKSDEEVLAAKDRGIRSVVLRLPFYVYGHGGSTFVPVQLGAARRDGVARFIGEGFNRVSSVHVDDAAQAYGLALEGAAAGSLYHLSDGQDVSAKQIAEAVGHNAGVPAVGVSFEEAEGAFGAGLARFFRMNSRISASRIERELGWKPDPAHDFLNDIAVGSYAGG